MRLLNRTYRPLTALLVALGGVTACAGGFEWVNVERIPQDLIATTDAWTAVRVNDSGHESWRVAADDFELTSTTRITRIVFYSVKFGEPDIVGGDWYVFEGGDEPGELLAFGADLKLTREDTGWSNPNLGDIYRNIMEPENLVLPAGHYFLAFRSVMSCPQGCVGKYSILSTRWANGLTRAYWNFGLLANGEVIDEWMLLERFNGIRDQEWAFVLEGEDNCGAIRRFKVKCRGGKLTAKVKSTLAQGTVLTIDNQGDRKQMVINSKGKGKVKYRHQSGQHRVSIVECPEKSKSVNCS